MISWLTGEKEEEVELERVAPSEFVAALDASLLEDDESATAVCTKRSWHIYEDKRNIERLNKGDSLFAFACSVGGENGNFTDNEKKIIAAHVNLSAFADEEGENNVPPLDIYSDEQASEYTIVMVRAAYLIKDVEPSDFIPEMYGIPDYHANCQPGNVGVDEEVPDDTTFRIQKTLIPMIWKMTLQLKCSQIDPMFCEKLAALDGGIPIDNAICMERTKRDKTVLDATRKIKSILAFTPVKAGVLVQMTTIVCNTFISSYASKIIQNLGSYGSAEVAETATLARQHIQKYIKQAKDIAKAKSKK